MNQQFIICLLTFLLSCVGIDAREFAATKPNIIYILCDDLGYGDVRCLNPQRGEIHVPNIDRLAEQGMAFTDAHSSSSVCTPTRYSVLTGRYNWRMRLQKGVFYGLDKPLITSERLTVPELLKQNGYHSACIGKWLLGLSFAGQPNKFDFTQPIPDGPIHRGFDYFFGICASLDMPPFAYIENDRFTQLPSVPKTWGRTGLAAPDFEASDVLPDLTRKAVEFINQRSATKKPFFLYLPLTSPHTPIVPTKEWQGKSSVGSYGDFVMQTDWALGEVLNAIDKNNIASNTLVIFTSDNGCAPYIGVDKLEQQGHYPSANLRGYKADLWDGGHRIPFIARWPGKIKPSTRSSKIVCLNDLMATCADIVGAKIPDDAGEDSISILPILLGSDKMSARDAIVHHSYDGSFAIRQGWWKLLLCGGSGSDGKKSHHTHESTQLYDMENDLSEKVNQAEAHPEIVARLIKLLEKYVAEGRSTPGTPQQNDVPIVIRKNSI